MAILSTEQSGDLYEDNKRRWKESLRPFSPGILSANGDSLKRKTDRSSSVSSGRRTRSRSISPTRLLTSTVSSRAKQRDAIRFEYKKPAKKVFPPRSRAKSASPSRSFPTKTRSSSIPRDDDDRGKNTERTPVISVDNDSGKNSGRTPMTWGAPSVLSWSGTPDKEHKAASQFRSHESMKETSQNVQTSGFQNQESNCNMMRENKKTALESCVKSDQQHIYSKEKNTSNYQVQENTTVLHDNVRKSRKKEKIFFEKGSNNYSERKELKLPMKTEIVIPVKTYKTNHSTSSLPTPDKTKPGQEQVAGAAGRRKSLSTSSYSKKTSVTRSIPGCVIA